MQKLIDHIRKQQDLMGYKQFCESSRENQSEYIRSISLALHKEVSEFLDEVPWKPWVPFEDQYLDIYAATTEICDIIVFALVLYITLDPPYSLEEVMEATLAKIDSRINNGYGRKEKD